MFISPSPFSQCLSVVKRHISVSMCSCVGFSDVCEIKGLYLKYLLVSSFHTLEKYEGAFTPDANEALSANDLHVKTMQRRDRQSCGAIRVNEAA